MSQAVQFTSDDLPSLLNEASEKKEAAPGFTLTEGATAEGGFDMNRLRLEAPQVYEGMLQAIAQHTCNGVRRSAGRIKEMMREERDKN